MPGGSASTRTRTSRRRTSRAARVLGSPCCASRASTARSRWPRLSSARDSRAVDVHMTDLIDRGATLEGFQGLVACGGFCYGDVLGAGEGWAKSILFNARARAAVRGLVRAADAIHARRLQWLPDAGRAGELIPGTAHWPRFAATAPSSSRAGCRWSRSRRRTRRFSPAWRARAAGRRRPWRGTRGIRERRRAAAAGQVALRYVDSAGRARPPIRRIPTVRRGHRRPHFGGWRVTILMPHPERVFARRRTPGTRPRRARTAAGCGCSGTRGAAVG